jgi:hypothetical protein
MNEAFADIIGETIDLLNNGIMAASIDDRDFSSDWPSYHNNSKKYQVHRPDGPSRACLPDFQTSNWDDIEDLSSWRWSVGEHIQVAEMDTPLRDMWVPECKYHPTCTTSLYYYQGIQDHYGVHFNSGILNRLYSVIVDGGLVTKDLLAYKGYYYTTYLDDYVEISGMGINKGFYMFYQTLEMSDPIDQFSDFGTKLYATCNLLLGTHAPKINLKDTVYDESDMTYDTESGIFSQGDCDAVYIALGSSGLLLNANEEWQEDIGVSLPPGDEIINTNTVLTMNDSIALCAIADHFIGSTDKRDQDSSFEDFYHGWQCDTSPYGNFLAPVNISIWEGVDINIDPTSIYSKVVGIALVGSFNFEVLTYGSSLTLPSELGSITSLKSLTLISGHWTGAIPSEIGNLPNLEVLIISENTFTSIPNTPGAFPSLRVLVASNNSLQGKWPDSPNLEVLIIDHNNFAGNLDTFIFRPSLRSINLEGNINLNTNSTSNNILENFCYDSCNGNYENCEDRIEANFIDLDLHCIPSCFKSNNIQYQNFHHNNVTYCNEVDNNPPSTNVDCVGGFNQCSDTCVKYYNISTPQSGSGSSCPIADGQTMACQPGEGLCPLVYNVDCVGAYSMCGVDCLKQYAISTHPEGNGAVCPADDGQTMACQPGEGLCPLVYNVDCVGE